MKDSSKRIKYKVPIVEIRFAIIVGSRSNDDIYKAIQIYISFHDVVHITGENSAWLGKQAPKRCVENIEHEGMVDVSQNSWRPLWSTVPFMQYSPQVQ
jgi:hypothetical protein